MGRRRRGSGGCWRPRRQGERPRDRVAAAPVALDHVRRAVHLQVRDDRLDPGQLVAQPADVGDRVPLPDSPGGRRRRPRAGPGREELQGGVSGLVGGLEVLFASPLPPLLVGSHAGIILRRIRFHRTRDHVTPGSRDGDGPAFRVRP